MNLKEREPYDRAALDAAFISGVEHGVFPGVDIGTYDVRSMDDCSPAEWMRAEVVFESWEWGP